jgi:TonB family protein
MKRTIVAILALSPVMLFAQAKTPAQPSSTPVLNASLLQPAGFAVKSTDNSAANTAPIRISTGVVAPKLVSSVELSRDAALHAQLFPGDRTVVLDMTVDKSGKPTALKVVQSADDVTDHDVLATVSQFRYQPGTLDGQPADFPIRLRFTVEQNGKY